MALTAAEKTTIDELRISVARASERERAAAERLTRMEAALIEKIDEVEGECVGFRQMAVKRWDEEDRRRQERVVEKKREDGERLNNRISKRMYVLGVIGACITLTGVLVTTIATLAGS